MLFDIIFWTARILTWLIIIDALLTWFPGLDRRNPLVVLLRQITTPIYAPIRKIIPPERTGYIDLSPLIAILALQLIAGLLLGLVAPLR